MEDKITAKAREGLSALTDDEKREALQALRRLIDEEMFGLAAGDGDGGEKRPESCPRCGGRHVAKRGRDAAGAQRYLCRGCPRSFAQSALNVLATTKPGHAAWMRYAQCHVGLCGLREARERCGAGLKTAWFMRHRTLEAISASLPPFRSSAGDGMEAGGTYLRESFSGNRANPGCGIPRAAHKRHEGSDNRERICVPAGADGAGDMFFEMAGQGSIDGERAGAFPEGKVASGATVPTDGPGAYLRVMRALDARGHVAAKPQAHGIDAVSNLHSRLEGFLRRFRSVATRRLRDCLAWLEWIWTLEAGRKAGEMAGMIAEHTGASTHKTTWRECRSTPYPFYDYWEKQAGWDAAARAALPLAALGS